MGQYKEKFWLRTMQQSAESIFRQFAAEYLHEFESILGLKKGPRARWCMKKTEVENLMRLSL
jgi:hypothetical protein